ncbi:MAG: pyridoxamine 5'-phosphate oxidase [Thermoleophilia bacterium]|nr:pyridoxamine 5'-phosphate oxidase [Thermoleophilia bacterium]
MRAQPFLESDALGDPLEQFRRWWQDAQGVVPLPEAMAVATATADGAPSVRMVLLKQADERGFVFHTNYESRKGRELTANPRAALLFHWYELGRQVRIEGAVEQLADEESDRYFETRPLSGRLSAWISRQSEAIPSREELEERVETLRQHLGEELIRPDFWGGYRLIAETYEFWQHRDDRLHDRFQYRRDGDRWVRERLAP